MNIVKELNKIAGTSLENRRKQQQQALDSVYHNLKIEDDKDREMLKYFGTSAVVEEVTTKANNLDTAKAEGLVSMDDVKKICLKYGLRFLPASMYKKEIPLKALNDLRTFSSTVEHGLVIPERLFIIAPVNHFKLEKRPVPVNNDPVLMYLFPSGLKTLSTWGSNFTWKRRLLGFTACYWQWIACPLALAIGIPTIVAVSKHMTPAQFGEGGPTAAMSLLLAVLAGILAPFSIPNHKKFWNSTFES